MTLAALNHGVDRGGGGPSLDWKFMSLVRGEDDEWTATAHGPQPGDVELGHRGDEAAALRRRLRRCRSGEARRADKLPPYY